MNKVKQKGLVPRLRFPDFKNDGQWAFKPLKGNFLTESKKLSDGKSEVFSVSVHKGFVNQIEHLGRSYSAANTSNYKLVLPFDVAYTKSPTGDFPFGIVKQNLHPKRVIVSPLYGIFTPINPSVGYLIHCYFESPANLNNFLAPIVQKGAKNTLQIANETFLSKEFCLPKSEQEQKVIADCLASMEGLLAIETNRLTALKEYKKSLLRQLYPAAGETVPRLRFPEFRKRRKWVQSRLGDLATNLDYKRVPISEKDREKGEIPYYGASGIIDYVKGFLFDERLLCISEDGANLIDRTYPIAFSIQGKTWVNNHAHVLRFKDAWTQILIEHYLNERSLEDFITGAAQPKLNQGNLERIPILLPSDDEQKKIAELLQYQSNAVDNQVKKLSFLKAHKNGLLQRLFPSLNSTGQ